MFYKPLIEIILLHFIVLIKAENALTIESATK